MTSTTGSRSRHRRRVWPRQGRRAERLRPIRASDSRRASATRARRRATWSCIANLPKPEGFFDPEAPAGAVTPPEARRRRTPAAPDLTPRHRQPAPRRHTPTPPQPPPPAGLHELGSRVQRQPRLRRQLPRLQHLRHRDARKPRLLASVVCPGGQGDVSIHGNLLFMSVEQTRGRIDCGTQGVQPPVSTERFRGIRIFDISDVNNRSRSRPCRPAAARTRTRWSPTRTTRRTSTSTDPAPSSVRSGEELAGCSGLNPKRIRTRRSSAST